MDIGKIAKELNNQIRSQHFIPNWGNLSGIEPVRELFTHAFVKYHNKMMKGRAKLSKKNSYDEFWGGRETTTYDIRLVAYKRTKKKIKKKEYMAKLTFIYDKKTYNTCIDLWIDDPPYYIGNRQSDKVSANLWNCLADFKKTTAPLDLFIKERIAK